MTAPLSDEDPAAEAGAVAPVDARPPGTERRARRPGNRLRRFFLDMLEKMHVWAEAGWAPQAVALWGALQGSICPGPADALLVPLGLADPKKAGRLAFAALAGSATGGFIAYGIGLFAFEEVGRPLLHLLGIEDGTIASSERLFDQRGWLIVLGAAVTPIPMKLVCIASGAFGVPAGFFAIGLIGGRGIRFAAIAIGLKLAGERVEKWAAKYRRRGREPIPPAGPLDRPPALEQH